MIIEPDTSKIRTYSNNSELINERRAQILKGAVDVFLQKGFKATTLRDISEASKISIGNIYRYIGSKDDLLHILCLARANARQGLENIAKENEHLNIPDLLKVCITYQFQVGDVSRTYNLFFNREIYHFSPEDRQVLLDTQLQSVDFFKDLLDNGVKNGEFQIRSTRALAHNILMLGHDWGLRYWYLSRYFTLEEYTEIQTDYIFKQILPPEKSVKTKGKS